MRSNFSNETTLYIQQYLHWHENKVMLNGKLLFESEGNTTLDSCTDIYRKAALNYPKFFKMDLLSKAAFLCSTMVLPKDIREDKSKIATVLSSTSGCLDVDKKFRESEAGIASPALFVYTLPNIMLGEICIANGFKGEQMCTLTDGADYDWIDFYINDLIKNRQTEAVLCGHVEATETGIDVEMCWVNKQPANVPFNLQNLSTLFSNK